MKDTQNNRNAIILWHYLKENPEASYADLAQKISTPEDKPNYINALIKKLQRGRYIEIERVRSLDGRISNSYKKTLHEPKINVK